MTIKSNHWVKNKARWVSKNGIFWAEHLCLWFSETKKMCCYLCVYMFICVCFIGPIHSKRFAPYKPVKMHRTCTIYAPYIQCTVHASYTPLRNNFQNDRWRIYFQLLMVVWCMYGALYGACMMQYWPLRTISQRCMAHVWCISKELEQFLSIVWCIHDQDYI